MKRKITFKGNPLTLVGRKIETGMIAPDFKVIAQDMKEITLADFAGKVKILTSFPSLDTPVCDLQVKTFNKKATDFSADVVVVGISKDLPFAQQRFCQAAGITNVIVVSDYRFGSFGLNYGLQIKELNLLARSILIVDKNNLIRYSQLVDELTNPPNYDEAISNLTDILKNPGVAVPESKLPAKCKPCEGGVKPLPPARVKELMVNAPNWQLVEDKKIQAEFKFPNFVEAMYFVNLVANLAEEQGHHPDIHVFYSKVKIELSTHAAGGLTENDFILAKIVDELAAWPK